MIKVAEMTPRERAAAAVVAAEDLAAGADRWQELAGQAREAVADLIAGPLAAVFHRDVVPLGADLLADLEHYTGGNARTFAGVHQAALEGHPALARLLRGSRALVDVRQAGGRGAAPASNQETTAAAEKRAGDKAVRAYQRTIGQQLAAAAGHELSGAGAALVDALELEQRLAAAEGHHQAAAEARAEQAREQARKASRRSARPPVTGGFDV